MPPQTVAQALPYINWIILASLAFGTFWSLIALGLTDDAPRGYLGFLAACAAILGGLALVADIYLPPLTDLAIGAASPSQDLARRAGLGLFVVSAIPVVMVARRPAGKAPVGTGLVASFGVLVLAAAGWAPTGVDAVPFAVQLGVLSAAAGGSLAALILGHWYLVTPKLSERPLVLQARMLVIVLGVQALLFVVWTTLGGGVDQGPWEALSGSSALLVWLRLIVTVAFPLVLAYMALRTAQTRSFESATGLLYINLAAVLAGTIGAAALYVTSGLLV